MSEKLKEEMQNAQTDENGKGRALEQKSSPPAPIVIQGMEKSLGAIFAQGL